MQSDAVVKYSDVIQHILLRLISGLVMAPLHLFLFQTAKETFCNCVVPTIPFPSHAPDESIRLQQLPVFLAGVLGTSVRMHNQPSLWFASPQCHPQCIAHQFRLHPCKV